MGDATGSHLAFLDDDDVFLPGAIDAMRQAACTSPVIFRMRYSHDGRELWQDQDLRAGNVGTPMIFVPNRPALLGTWAGWGSDTCGDFRFIYETVEKMGEPVWNETVVALIRPL